MQVRADDGRLMKTLQQEILEKIEAKRERKKLPRYLLLEKAGIAESTYYRWISGEFRPRLSTLEKLLNSI